MMTRVAMSFGLLVLSASSAFAQAVDKTILVVHGGANSQAKDAMTLAQEKTYRDGLERALRAGRAALQRPGGTSLDAVEAAIIVLEDDPGRDLGFLRHGRLTVTGEGKVALRAVTLGRNYGESVEIVDGISATDRLVLNPSDSLTDGDTVVLAANTPQDPK